MQGAELEEDRGSGLSVPYCPNLFTIIFVFMAWKDLTLLPCYTLKNGTLKCSSCKKEASITAGTIFNKTRTPLKDWFGAIWYITNQKNGISALGIYRLLGLGSYQTAWTILHKLRSAMVNPERQKLSGLVEVDETFVRGVIPRKGSKNKQKKHNAVVLIAVELLEPKGFGRIRLRHVTSGNTRTCHPIYFRCSRAGQCYLQ